MFTINGQSAVVEKLMAAIKENNEEAMRTAWGDFQKSVADAVRKDFEDLADEKDERVLAARGYRTLTTKEKRWYERVISALKSGTPKQKFMEIIGSGDEEDIMPSTIIEDVFRHLQEDHPLLKAINMQYTGYITKWIRNNHTAQMAVWGPITDEIEKEIKSAVDVIDVRQSQLSAFAVIELGMLELGPTWLDAYIRACLYEALLLGLEDAVILGNGVNAPIGLIRDISNGVAVSTTEGYPEKSALLVHDFTPGTYGQLVARLATTENGSKRRFGKVSLICNLQDYLAKIMPATTVQAADGTYKNNLFPFPTETIISTRVPDGYAILCLLEEYNLFVGGDKSGAIEYDDSVKFFQNARAFRVVQYATGRAFDNTSAILLDIADMDESYLTVIQKTATTRYNVTLAATTNGTAKLSQRTGKAGDVVTVSAKPASGYELDAISVKNGATDVTVTNGRFTMPAANVTVTVTFKTKS